MSDLTFIQDASKYLKEVPLLADDVRLVSLLGNNVMLLGNDDVSLLDRVIFGSVELLGNIVMLLGNAVSFLGRVTFGSV